MNVYIPSRSRYDRVVDPGRTLHQLMRAPMEELRVFVVVPEDQASDYKEVIDKAIRDAYSWRNDKFPAVQVLSCPVDGISRVRQWIAQHAEAAGDEHFCMMDDDLGFLIRKQPGDWHLRAQTSLETMAMLVYIKELLSDKYAAVGVSPREGNNRFEECPNVNTRLIRVLAFRTKDFLACEHGRVTVMEDFDILLQLLRRGLPNAMTVNYAQGQKMTQESGGCSDYRSHEVHAVSATTLCSLHPGFVRLREKKNRSGGAFGQRKEVTIYWKKAFESSQIVYGSEKNK